VRVLQKGQFQADPQYTACLILTIPIYTVYNKHMFSQALERPPTLRYAPQVAHTLLNTAEVIV